MIAFKKDYLNFIEKFEIKFFISEEHEILRFENVALLTVCKEIKTGLIFVITNIHIYYKFTSGHVKLVYLHLFYQALN